MSLDALSSAGSALNELQTQLSSSIITSDKMPEPFRSNVAALPETATLIVNLAKDHITASEEERKKKKKLVHDRNRIDLDLAMVDLAVYIATLTEAIVRPLLLVDKPPEPGDRHPHTMIIDPSTVMQVEAFRWELEYVQHQVEVFITRRIQQPQPLWGKLLGRQSEEDAKDALAIGGLSSRIQKVVTVYQLETNVALRAQVDGLRKEMHEMARPSRHSGHSIARKRTSGHLTLPKAGDSNTSLDGSRASPRPPIPPKPQSLRPMRSLPSPPNAGPGDRQSGAISITIDSNGVIKAEQKTEVEGEIEPLHEEDEEFGHLQHHEERPDEDEPRAPSMTALQVLFPDVDPSLLAAVANHSLAAADLYKLSSSPFREQLMDNSAGSIRSKKGSGVGTSTYPHLSSILQPLTTYFAILIRTVPPQLAPSIGAASMQYLGDLRELAEKYEWYAVLQYHFAFWRRRRQEMGELGEFGGWGRREEDLVTRYLEPHIIQRRAHHKRSTTMPHSPSPNGAITPPVGRTPTIISQTQGGHTRRVSRRSSKASHRDDGSVTRVYSIGSCPACKNGRMNSCRTCEGRNSAPVEGIDELALDDEEEARYIDGR